ncbi:MAG TPA: hydrogenase expression/formation protein HypE, partial [Candidatus Hodarchaeales archaeon]|nr:hydrogenase expression/formation protein HypE [Candidatus Hodarchaeales archaeon]
MLGLDPLDITCEGCALIAVSKTDEGITLEKLRKHPLGTEAAAIGTVTAEGKGRVLMETRVGGLRRLQKPVGELIPRVC